MELIAPACSAGQKQDEFQKGILTFQEKKEVQTYVGPDTKLLTSLVFRNQQGIWGEESHYTWLVLYFSTHHPDVMEDGSEVGHWTGRRVRVMQDSSCGGVLPLPGSSPLLNLFSAMGTVQKHQLISLKWIKTKRPLTGESQEEAWSQMWISGTTWGTWEGCHLGHSSLISPEQCLSGH